MAETLPKDAIILARSMGAAELLDYPRDKLRGLVIEEGAITSHVVIVAKAMSIPVVGQVKGAVAMAENGDAIIIDGVDGKVHLRPQADVELAYAEKVRFRAKRQEMYRELRDLPCDLEGRRQGRSVDECRPDGRSAAAGRIGRGGHRPFPH